LLRITDIRGIVSVGKKKSHHYIYIYMWYYLAVNV
jgi:hypothetical protein